MDNELIQSMKMIINGLMDLLTNIASYLDGKVIMTELIKTIFTAILGFITFRIYQGYKNKKENHLLYRFLLKLRNESLENIEKLRIALNKHSEFEKLIDVFSVKQKREIYELYEKISKLSIYLNESPVRNQHGEVVDMEYAYEDKPYTQIDQLESHINSIEFESEYDESYLEDMKDQLKYIEGKSLLKELVEIHSRKNKINCSKSLEEPLKFLFEQIEDFLSYDSDGQMFNLDAFCTGLLDRDNIFSKSLNRFTELRMLEREVQKPKGRSVNNSTVKIEYIVWEQTDSQLLAVYDINAYLRLDTLFQNNKAKEVNIWEIESIKSEISLIESSITYEIDKTIEVLERTIRRTNQIFKGI